MTLDAAVVQRHVHNALQSPLFAKAERQARFLRYVVDAALQSPAPHVREFDIAMAVYDRRHDYDPRTDPIVRVEASRLRARLREYYEHSPPTHLRIELPKGAYLPRFVAVDRTGPALASAASVLVDPLRSLSPDPMHAAFCEGVTEELVHHLTQDGRLRVVMATVFQRHGGVEPRYLIEASARHSGSEVRLTVRLVDIADATTRLSNQYRDSLDDLFAAQERLGRQICGDLVNALFPDGAKA